MIDWYKVYRFIAPFRSRLQERLRKERERFDFDAFARAFDIGDDHLQIAHALWDLLRARAFVYDFRPHPDDDLYKVFAMDEEIVWDEVIKDLMKKLNLSLSGIDLTGFDIHSVTTPRHVMAFLVKIAQAQHGEGGRRFTDMA